MTTKNFPISRDEVLAIIEDPSNLDGDTYEKLFAHYASEMPYGTAKARTGDPDQWIYYRLVDEFGGTSVQ